MWLDGTPYWRGVQMDETALPILLVDLAAREGVIDKSERAEDPGYSPFTIAAEIAALLVAADLADAAANTAAATYLRETADAWNASIERWLYVAGTTLAQQHGVTSPYRKPQGLLAAARTARPYGCSLPSQPSRKPPRRRPSTM